MKGIVFTELFDMVEASYGADVIDDVLDECTLETDGAYTSVGTYNHTELFQIVNALSKHSGQPAKDLIHQYGRRLFFRFHDMMPNFFEKPQSAFEFLESVHDTIHVEVKKLYPDASLPHFTTKREGKNTLTMIYQSQCPLADFADGLIHGCIDFYKEDIAVDTEDLNATEGHSRIFTLRKR